MMADLFLAAKTAQVESSVNVMDVSVVVITLILILALFFYIRLIHKNTDSVFMDIKKDILDTLEDCNRIMPEMCKKNMFFLLLQGILRIFAPLL